MNRVNFILQSFGLDVIKPKLYKPGTALPAGNTDLSTIVKRELNEVDANMSTMPNGQVPVSMLGTPVFCDMILKGQDESSQIQLLWVLAEVNQSKLIEKTSVQGRDGTVKEYISDGDYQVSIRGGLVTPFSYAYPMQDVQTLHVLLKLKEPLKVVSEYLQMFGIFELVVEDYSFPQREGSQNVQLFDIKCVSDEPIELRIAQ